MTDRRPAPAHDGADWISESTAPAAAIEQLYDELMSRAWALCQVLGEPAVDVRRVRVHARIAAVATAHVHRLLRTGPDELRHVLWPTSPAPAPDDHWWRTPLGELMSSPRSQP